MLILLGILAASSLGAIIYIFRSQKSTKIQKYAALGALILSGIAVLICGFLIIFGGGAQNDPYHFPLAAETAPQVEANSRIGELLIFLVIFLLVFGFIIYSGIKDQKNKAIKRPDTNRAPSFKTTPKKPVPEKVNIDDSDDFDFALDDDFNDL